MGEVKNNTGSAQIDVDISLVLYDSNGTTLANDRLIVPTQVMPNGVTLPFMFWALDVPSTPARYSFSVNPNSEPPELIPRTDFPVSNLQRHLNDAGELVLTGQVTNNGTAAPVYAEIFVAFYNQDGKVVAMVSAFLDDTFMGPSQTVSFELIAEGRISEVFSETATVLGY
ncbi:MAG TPA: FxLYD domain-containing protein [Anaerolineae bacterium]|nr:FxLYD domain-containing protein [Anaerolineae bacterium]